jgi:hypothetical protein
MKNCIIIVKNTEFGYEVLAIIYQTLNKSSVSSQTNFRCVFDICSLTLKMEFREEFFLSFEIKYEKLRFKFCSNVGFNKN